MMKIRLFVMLLIITGVIHAQSTPLPPVVDHSIYPGGTSYAAKPNATSTLYELLGRMEQLQVEVQQLRGIVEEQAYTITELSKRQNTIYSDLDQRLQIIETGNVSNDPKVLGAIKPEEQSSIEATAQRQSKSGLQRVPSSQAESEKQRYQDAYETLKNGHYGQSIIEFKRFLNDFPAGDYSDNAQYWLGEAYKVNREIERAKEAFEKVVNNFPNSSKVKDALLKLGYIEFEQNNYVKAREYFTRITVGYPGTTAAHLANKKLLQMDNTP